jgi:hypothetical protein
LSFLRVLHGQTLFETVAENVQTTLVETNGLWFVDYFFWSGGGLWGWWGVS